MESEIVRLSAENSALCEQLAEAEAEAAELRRDLALLRNQQELDASHAAGSELALFILHKIAQARTIGISEVASNIEGQEGWLAVARLLKGRMIDEDGSSFSVTPSGRKTLAQAMASYR